MERVRRCFAQTTETDDTYLFHLRDEALLLLLKLGDQRLLLGTHHRHRQIRALQS